MWCLAGNRQEFPARTRR